MRFVHYIKNLMTKTCKSYLKLERNNSLFDVLPDLYVAAKLDC